METTCYVVLAIGWLLLAPLANAAPGSAAMRSRLGDILINADASNAMLALGFCLAVALFYVLLYRSGIVPRWIAVWGLIAIPAYGAAELVPMYEAMEPNSTVPVMLDFPMLLQELVLAVWMIARGFRPVTAHADG